MITVGSADTWMHTVQLKPTCDIRKRDPRDHRKHPRTMDAKTTTSTLRIAASTQASPRHRNAIDACMMDKKLLARRLAPGNVNNKALVCHPRFYSVEVSLSLVASPDPQRFATNPCSIHGGTSQRAIFLFYFLGYSGFLPGYNPRPSGLDFAGLLFLLQIHQAVDISTLPLRIFHSLWATGIGTR